MSVPVAASVRRSVPDAEIWWVIEARCAAVVDDKRLVNKLHSLDRELWKEHRWSPRIWRDQLKSFSDLRKQRFDYGIDLQGHSKTAICLKIAAPKKRVAAHSTDVLVQMMNPVVKGDQTGVHTVDWNLKTLRTLGDFSTEARWTMPVLTAERVHARTIGSKIASIAVSSGRAAKNYPAEKWAEVAKHLMRQGFQVVFLGGPTDCAPDVPGSIDWVNKASLSETMGAVAESSIHLAADTGTGHMAAAYGVPVVSLFGPTSPEFFAPYTEKRVVLRKDSKVTADISPQEILEASQTLQRTYETALPG